MLRHKRTIRTLVVNSEDEYFAKREQLESLNFQIIATNDGGEIWRKNGLKASNRYDIFVDTSNVEFF